MDVLETSNLYRILYLVLSLGYIGVELCVRNTAAAVSTERGSTAKNYRTPRGARGLKRHKQNINI